MVQLRGRYWGGGGSAAGGVVVTVNPPVFLSLFAHIVYTSTEGLGAVVFIYSMDRGVKITIEKIEEGGSCNTYHFEKMLNAAEQFAGVQTGDGKPAVLLAQIPGQGRKFNIFA